MYSRPSTEVNLAPCPLRKEIGVPPTPLNARTGLCTPPGQTRSARSKYLGDRSSVSIAACWGNIFRHLKRRRRFALPAHSILNTEFFRIPRPVRNDELRAATLENMPCLQQRFFKLNQTLLG